MIKLVEWDLDIPSKEALFSKIATTLENQGIVLDREILLQKLYDRESFGDTLIAPNFAIPHIVLSEVTQSSYVFVRLVSPILNWHNQNSVTSILFVIVKAHEDKSILLEIRSLFRQMASEELIEQLINGDMNQVQLILDNKGE